ncbi:adenosylcobinamide amidohydrolase [Paracoccus alkenifer]|uniref:Adenosylcobinamide hydrolase n=1 Tax=Paracoccus alkenifer TaxID=65735 RepID=A0A1H6JU80_9RHOB|nr:adenosylcobinamide amidohydrolase [Paracoccus alkenifer]SEH62821.1 adenosylcobinamide hydrolase [Paracoccus alkenifer]
MQLSLTPPWLVADLGRPRRVLSFAPHNPGFRTARHILMRELRNADLPPGLDAHRWLEGQLQATWQRDSVCMMTSRALRHYRVRRHGPVCCLATVGLGNAERVGHRRPAPSSGYGTINLAILIEAGLSETAMIEALTIAAQARTLAVLTAAIALPAGAATGTGTDCIALACDAGDTAYAGLHTELGEALGRAVHDAVLAGARDWVAAHGHVPPDHVADCPADA